MTPSLALTVDKNREDHNSLDKSRTLEFECDIQVAPLVHFQARHIIRDIDLVVHYRICYHSPHDGYDESPERRVVIVGGEIIGHSKSDLALALVIGVRETD